MTKITMRGPPLDSLVPSGTCERCDKRPATSWWVGEGGLLGWTHGFRRPWCDVCCLEAQIEYAEAAAAQLPEMKARLAKMLEAERVSDGGKRTADEGERDG